MVRLPQGPERQCLAGIGLLPAVPPYRLGPVGLLASVQGFERSMAWSPRGPLEGRNSRAGSSELERSPSSTRKLRSPVLSPSRSDSHIHLAGPRAAQEPPRQDPPGTLVVCQWHLCHEACVIISEVLRAAVCPMDGPRAGFR
jgi:hypothetical protein